MGANLNCFVRDARPLSDTSCGISKLTKITSARVWHTGRSGGETSCEQQERPELRGKPVDIVPVLAETTFCIAASYAAKARRVILFLNSKSSITIGLLSCKPSQK
jgi:hypothetical protein